MLLNKSLSILYLSAIFSGEPGLAGFIGAKDYNRSGRKTSLSPF